MVARGETTKLAAEFKKVSPAWRVAANEAAEVPLQAQ